MQHLLTDTAETVLARRYYLKDEDGNIIEDWACLCERVAKAVSNAEPKKEDRTFYKDAFFNMIHNLDFLPNSPCLMNAGTDLGQLSACFVLPIEDSLAGIFDSMKNGALVNKTGGGTGYSFSRLRAENSSVCSTNGVASGPISFATVFDKATDVIKQGGRRRGANMGVLRCDHPDVLKWIDCKRDKTLLTNFNLSVALTDQFMENVKTGANYPLIDPQIGAVVGEVNALEVFNRIVDAAWDNGEPGVLFIDAANRVNPTPHLGNFEATNPCGEQWLLPYEACNLGSINLGQFVVKKTDFTSKKGQSHESMQIDWQRLEDTVRLAVRFLDNVVDVSKFPIPEITEMTRKTRKLGLGIMGLHDMLIKLEVPYGSETGRDIAADVMAFIRLCAGKASVKLAVEKGQCPAFPVQYLLRNAALTSIQPTGTVSMIADCASGCEPYFSTVMIKNVMDGDRLLMVNKLFERVAREEGFYSEALMEQVAREGSIANIEAIPIKYREIFATAQDISPMDHILMQAALQNNGVDASISKTINMPSNATKEDIAGAYMLAWEEGCKGVTIYRDGSRDNQVLNAGSKEKIPSALLPIGDVTTLWKSNLPDVLSAKRYRLKDTDNETMYLIVCFDQNEKPMEVFAKFPFDNRIDLKDKSTMWTTTCRLVSLALRCCVPMEEIIKQLDRSSGHMKDLPAQLAKLLKSFMSTTSQGFIAVCPDCRGQVIFEEGCECCKSCGYSKCS